MIRWILNILSFLKFLIAWGSFLGGVWISAHFAIEIFRKEERGFKKWFWMILGGLYALIFLAVRIFLPDAFENFWAPFSMMVIFISATYMRYEDKKNNRRWWNW